MVVTAERIESSDQLRRRIEHCQRELIVTLEPNFGLVEELRSCGVLSSDEREEIRAAKTRSKRCKKLLKYTLGKSDDTACCALLEALDNTEQRHVVNFLLQDAGT